MLYAEDFSMRRYVRFSQIGSHLTFIHLLQETHCTYTHIKITSLWQDCGKAATRLCTMNKVVTRWWQGCDNIVYNAHGGDKIVTRSFPTSKVMARLSQPCDKVVQHTHNLVKDKIKTHSEYWYLIASLQNAKLKPFIVGEVVKFSRCLGWMYFYTCN